MNSGPNCTGQSAMPSTYACMLNVSHLMAGIPSCSEHRADAMQLYLSDTSSNVLRCLHNKEVRKCFA